MPSFDIIPDLHADPQRLQATLTALGPGSHPAFLGDFIDSRHEGADDLAVLHRIRTLIEDRDAPAVMGNHELNAILFHRRGPDGQPLRPQNDKNAGQHRGFLAAFGTETPAALEWTGWFLRALPLWRDLDGLRLVHACWNDAAIALIAHRRPDGRLQPEDLAEVADFSTPFGAAVKLLTSGPEAQLPDGLRFHDLSGHPRREVRLAWWQSGAATWAEAALSVPRPDELPPGPLPADVVAEIYPADAPPVFVGHYKMQGTPRLQAPNAACLDYPDHPCAYRWRGEARLDPAHLLRV